MSRRDRIRIQRENADRAWRLLMGEGEGADALREIWHTIMAKRESVKGLKQYEAYVALNELLDGIADRCRLTDERAWLVWRARHDVAALDDGRAQDKQAEAEEGEE